MFSLINDFIIFCQNGLLEIISLENIKMVLKTYVWIMVLYGCEPLMELEKILTKNLRMKEAQMIEYARGCLIGWVVKHL